MHDELVPAAMSGEPRACASRHGVAAPRGQQPLPGTRGGRFGRMFPFLPHRDPGDAALRALADFAVGQFSRENTLIPAGFTYFGQFVDHDITFDPTSKLQGDNDPHALVNFRTPRLDLDSLYGSGPEDQPFLYDWKCRHPGVKLLVDCTTSGTRAPVDLPRNRQDRALIADARNDENLILSQLHLLFIRFHNRVVDHCAAGDGATLTHHELLEQAQRIVRWHYQWMITHDFLTRIVGDDVLQRVLDRLPSGWRGEPAIPVEFSGAAYRFGHSMVRKAYVVNGELNAEIFPVPGGAMADLTGFQPLPKTHVIQWNRFFWVTFDADAGLNASMRIDPVLALPLGALPLGVTQDGPSLAFLNLRRGRALRLPAGTDVAQAIGVAPLTPRQFLPDRFAAGKDVPPGALEALRDAAPLWYYVLAEARVHGGDGQRLGPVGGRIVAEVLVGLLESDPQSYLRQWPSWKPTLPCKKQNFTMLDLLDFVRDDEPCATDR